MSQPLEQLIAISRKVGANKSLVLGNYGNTSVKTADGRFMYVKASGAELGKMTSRRGWRKVHLQRILDILDDRTLAELNVDKQKKAIDIALLKACLDKKPASVMPSIETFFHALLGPVVVHLHPESVLAAACAKKGKEQVETLFDGETYPPLWLPFTGLGYVCAQMIRTLALRYEKEHGRKPAMIVMQNHGLLVSANSNLAAMRLIHKAVRKCSTLLILSKPGKIQPSDSDYIETIKRDIGEALRNSAGIDRPVHYYTNETIERFVILGQAPKLCAAAALTPDELAVTGGAPIWVQKPTPGVVEGLIRRRLEKDAPMPVGFLVRGAGLFVAASAGRADYLAEFFCSYLKVRGATVQSGGPRPIPAKLAAMFAEPG